MLFRAPPLVDPRVFFAESVAARAGLPFFGMSCLTSVHRHDHQHLQDRQRLFGCHLLAEPKAEFEMVMEVDILAWTFLAGNRQSPGI